MSSITACDSGTSAAPKKPCSSRATTICASDSEMPHRIEAIVKPAIETSSTCLSPKRSVSQPASGVAMPAATMYEVSTQVIWSSDADRLPCMCGRATLAMVPSIAWMMVASITEMVIMPRCAASPWMVLPSSAAAALMVAGARC